MSGQGKDDRKSTHCFPETILQYKLSASRYNLIAEMQQILGVGAAPFISIYFPAHLRTRGQHIKAAVLMTPERIVTFPQDCACYLNVCGTKGAE